MSRLFIRGLMAAGLATAGLNACVTMGGRGPGASIGSNVPGGPASRAVRELYIGPGVVQYFLLPQRLMGLPDQHAELDLVVRDSAQIPRYGLLHLSVVSSAAVHFPADTLLLNMADGPLALPAARVLFSEPKGKARLTRIEIYLTPAQTTAYLQSPTHGVVLGGATGRYRFDPDKKAAAALAALSAKVLGH